MSKKKIALITGITGQDGSFLIELLLSKDYEVHGIIRRASNFNTQRINHLYQDIQLHYGDLSDGVNLESIVLEVQPDEIYNLGAMSHVMVSFSIPEYTFDVVGTGVVRMLEALKKLDKPAKFYQASSSEMFGKVRETPQTELTPFNPRSPYAVAKCAAFYISAMYRESYGLYISNGILYNHESDRRGETFVTRKITRAATRIKLGLQDKLYLGNLDARRDWGYAKDHVEAMWLMLQQDQPDDYIISTGQTKTVREFLNGVFDRLDLDTEQYVQIDQKYVRPSEVDSLCGDSTKALNKLGWKAKTSFDELIDIMIEHDLEIAERELREAKQNVPVS